MAQASLDSKKLTLIDWAFSHEGRDRGRHLSFARKDRRFSVYLEWNSGDLHDRPNVMTVVRPTEETAIDDALKVLELGHQLAPIEEEDE